MKTTTEELKKINGVLAEYGISSVEESREICKAAGFDPYEIAKGIQPICFENVCWAYCVGAAIALKKGVKKRCRSRERYRNRITELLYRRFCC